MDVRMTLLVHVVAGSLGLVSGFVALYATKGARLHRRAGMAFVYAMLTMCVAGTAMAAVRGVWVEVNVPAGVISAYLVVTALTTVRPAFVGSKWLHVGAMLVALSVGLTELAFGVEALASGGTRNGIPAFPFFLFGVVGVLAGAGDARVLRAGAPTGARRLARHLWRMSFALFIAAMSFFIGQAKVIPEPIRIPALLALPVLAVPTTMLYWFWRVRFKRSRPSVIVVRAPRAA
jgi:hypothetical protein